MSSSDDGFSLVEALIAMAILAGTVSTILMVVASNAERSATSIDRLRASFAADAILARVGLDIPPVPQQSSGRLRDGSTWRVEISRYSEPDFSDESVSRLIAVTVTVEPEDSPGIVLKSLRRLGYQR